MTSSIDFSQIKNEKYIDYIRDYVDVFASADKNALEFLKGEMKQLIGHEEAKHVEEVARKLIVRKYLLVGREHKVEHNDNDILDGYSYTEIYNSAIDKPAGSSELKAKDAAQHQLIDYMKQIGVLPPIADSISFTAYCVSNDIDLSAEIDKFLSLQGWDIKFNRTGNIIEASLPSGKDLRERLMFEVLLEKAIKSMEQETEAFSIIWANNSGYAIDPYYVIYDKKELKYLHTLNDGNDFGFKSPQEAAELIGLIYGEKEAENYLTSKGYTKISREAPSIVFYDKSTDDGFITDLLNKHKIYDIECYEDGGDLYLMEGETVWKNTEIFELFCEEIFVVDPENGIDLLTAEDEERFFKLRDKYHSRDTDILADRSIDAYEAWDHAFFIDHVENAEAQIEQVNKDSERLEKAYKATEHIKRR